MTVNTQELRELLEKATPGPWAVRYDYVVQAPSFDDGRLVPVAQPYGVNSDGTDLFANARLIAAARNALPALLDEIDALRAALHTLICEVVGLVEESEGVYGLHLNGDPSPWEELLPGGRFERLTSLHDAEALIAPPQGETA